MLGGGAGRDLITSSNKIHIQRHMCVSCVWQPSGGAVIRARIIASFGLSALHLVPRHPLIPPLPSNPATPDHRPTPEPPHTLTHHQGSSKINTRAEEGRHAQPFFSYLTQIKSILIKSAPFPCPGQFKGFRAWSAF